MELIPLVVLRTKPSFTVLAIRRPSGLKSLTPASYFTISALGIDPADRRMNVGFTTDDMAEFYEFLDDLRESGETNMFGAAPYLANEYGFDKETARGILKMWMDTFDGEKTPQERALA